MRSIRGQTFCQKYALTVFEIFNFFNFGPHSFWKFLLIKLFLRHNPYEQLPNWESNLDKIESSLNVSKFRFFFNVRVLLYHGHGKTILSETGLSLYI